MQFSGDLTKKEQENVDVCDVHLTDPARLKALENTALMDSISEEAFDRLAKLAAQVLKVPLTIISLVSDKKQFFKAGYGLPAPFDVSREVPIDSSICRYTLAGIPIIADDASTDPLLKYHPTTGPWGIGAFIALPMITEDGFVLGAFCAVDVCKRPWSEDDISVMRELTASVMTEINLRSQISKLRLEQKMRETFVAALTHDLRTPLTSSKMNAQFLIKRTIDAPELQKIAMRISDNIDRSDRMIQNLLDASQIKAGEKISLECIPCILNEIVILSLDDLKTIYGDRFKFSAEEEIKGSFDAMAIRRILENLLGNAIKYGSQNSMITVSLNKKNNSAILSVHNLGNPIPELEQKNIFEAFHRSSSAAQGNQKGWGIGLTLVKGLAEAHGGEASVESSLENGTFFSVKIPF